MEVLQSEHQLIIKAPQAWICLTIFVVPWQVSAALASPSPLAQMSVRVARHLEWLGERHFRAWHGAKALLAL